MKYKVGDKVRVREWDEMEKEFGLDSDGDIRCEICFARAMKKFCGKIFTVGKVYDTFYDLKRGESFCFSDDMIEPVSDKKIVITTDGKTTLARLFEDGKVTKTAKAKCAPDDEFYFTIGAKTAFERLINHKPIVGGLYKVIGNGHGIHHSFNTGDTVKLVIISDGASYYKSEIKGYCQFIGDADVELITKKEPKKKPEEKQYRSFTGKAVCIEADQNGETGKLVVGKVYNFRNGIIPGINFLSAYKDCDGYVQYPGIEKYAKFLELKE